MSQVKIYNANGKLISSAKNELQLGQKAQSIVLDLVKTAHSVFRKELDHWKMARAEFLNGDHPKTWLLQEVYNDAAIDSHLTAVMENRILRIVNKRFVLTDKKGIQISEKSALFEKKWFGDLLRYAMESIFFGYSLMFVEKDKATGEITGIRNIDRRHVIPQNNIVVKEVTDDKGLDYSLFPNDLIFIKMYNGLGLLEKATPLTILKRHSWASWDEFEQIFGMPIRIAKIGSMSDAVKTEVAHWLENMGTAAYGVFPAFAEIDIKEANNRDAFNVFMKKIEKVDEQISVLVNGQTMTTLDGSSYSQANVHQKTQDEITRADIKTILHFLNDRLKPTLQALGYPVGKDEMFAIEQTTDPGEKIKTDAILLQNGYRLTKEYIEKTYGVELDDTPTAEKKK